MPLLPILVLTPFAKWGLDFVGPINPPSSAGHRYIVTATDYMTKWVEAVPLKKIDQETTPDFIYQWIMCRFGVPLEIVSDRGAQFMSQLVATLMEQLQIKHLFFVAYHPKGNGLAESTNKTLVHILKHMVGQHKREWHILLFSTLWAYHTTFKASTQATPFSLVYGFEAILPIQLEILSLQAALASGEFLSEDPLLARLEALLALDEQRLVS
eukprot:Gb_07726 [translate_table: standard]